MAKKTYYFTHDYNAKSDDKIKKLIRKHGILGYGIFWSLVEDLYNNENSLNLDFETIAYDMRVDVDIVKSVVNDFSLFLVVENCFSSKSISERLAFRDEKSEKARQSALKKWEITENNKIIPLHDSLPIDSIAQTHVQNDAIAQDINANAYIIDAIASKSDANLPKSDAIKERKGKEIKEIKENSNEKEISQINAFALKFDYFESNLLEKELLASDVWHEDVSRYLKTKSVFYIPLELKQKIPEFMLTLKSKGKFPITLSDAKSYFTNWIPFLTKKSNITALDYEIGKPKTK